MNRSSGVSEKRRLVDSRMEDGRDEDLALFREMRNREKERDNLLLQNPNEFDDPLGSKNGSSRFLNIPSVRLAPVSALAPKSAADDFLNSDSDKNDYDWLLTPPGTPLFPSLEMESHKIFMNKMGNSKVRPAYLKSRLANSSPEPSRGNLSSRHLASSFGLNASTGALHRPSGPGLGPSTPTGSPSIGPTPPSISTPASNKAMLKTPAKPILTTSMSKTSRTATPTRPTLPSKNSSVPPRSSTPVAKSSIRSSTPTSSVTVLKTKSIYGADTPTRKPNAGNSTAALVRSPTSVVKPISPTVKTLVPPRSNSPTVKPITCKPSEMSGFSVDVLPNLRTSLPDKSLSATRGRPGAPSSGPSSIELVSNGRVRRQSCSPSRSRPPNGLARYTGSSVPVPALSRLHAKANENVSPVLIGTKMVERVVNMRKLVPPKQETKHPPHTNASGKPSVPDSSGFGTTFSKKSLDMAIRHMDIRQTIPGNPPSRMNNISTPSKHSMKSGPNRSRTISLSDSSVASSSYSSSESSVKNVALSTNGPGACAEVSSRKVIRSHSTIRRKR